ncbi:MAG: hypothetical protein LBE32_04010 [Burkholderiales bacterium]|nr:hypothetical protein [Burkholderiales bacterium]
MKKLIAALPYERRITAETSRIFAPDFGNHDTVRAFFDQIHSAMIKRQVLRIDYIDEQSRRTQRSIQPLGLFLWVASLRLQRRGGYNARFMGKQA